jgi:hypothetical protein
MLCWNVATATAQDKIEYARHNAFSEGTRTTEVELTSEELGLVAATFSSWSNVISQEEGV